jgi:tyrosinase
MISTAIILIAGAICACQDNIRKEWREMTALEQADYLRAANCLRAKPSKLNPSFGSPNRFSDFAFAHSGAMYEAHNTPAFFPWHRSFLHTFEQVMRTECDYKGFQPYWYKL